MRVTHCLPHPRPLERPPANARRPQPSPARPLQWNAEKKPQRMWCRGGPGKLGTSPKHAEGGCFRCLGISLPWPSWAMHLQLGLSAEKITVRRALYAPYLSCNRCWLCRFALRHERGLIFFSTSTCHVTTLCSSQAFGMRRYAEGHVPQLGRYVMLNVF